MRRAELAWRDFVLSHDEPRFSNEPTSVRNPPDTTLRGLRRPELLPNPPRHGPPPTPPDDLAVTSLSPRFLAEGLLVSLRREREEKGSGPWR